MNYQKGFFVGRDTSNRRQVKKHFLQMSDEEKALIRLLALEYLKNGKLSISNHLLYKMNSGTVNVSKKSINRLRNSDDFSVVEFSHIDRDGKTHYRVLLRSSYTEKVLVHGRFIDDCNLCIVIELTSDEVVTAYWNKVSDNHPSINLSKYSKDVDIISLILS